MIDEGDAVEQVLFGSEVNVAPVGDRGVVREVDLAVCRHDDSRARLRHDLRARLRDDLPARLHRHRVARGPASGAGTRRGAPPDSRAAPSSITARQSAETMAVCPSCGVVSRIAVTLSLGTRKGVANA